MRLMTRRDVTVGGIAAALAFSLTAAVRPQGAVQHSIAIDWNSITATKTAVGETRQFMRAPTATLDELELHVTTLTAGQTSHAPHQHPNEELVIIREGTVEVLVQGNGNGWPWSVIFNASNELHGLRNVGSGPATYHVELDVSGNEK